MTTIDVPLSLNLAPLALDSLPGGEMVIRRLSDMAAYFSDTEAVKRILADGDPVLYEFWALEQEGAEGVLSFGLTRIRPGRVGREYHMTKGHFHTRGGDEIYVVGEGRGLLLLQTREGDTRAIEMVPGKMYFVPSLWAHRTANVGDGDLVFLSVWPGDVEHDYETIVREGFRKLVLEGRDGPSVTDVAEVDISS